MKGFLTYRRLARRLGVSECSLRRWVKRGVFPSPIRIAGTAALRFDPLEVERHLERQREGSNDAR